MAGLYIHIPFCASRCHYCDFTSSAGRSELIEPYLEALRREALARAVSPDHRPDTLYVGGGTPGFLSPAQLERLFSIIENSFGPVRNFTESSFEVNPESLTPLKAALLKKSGISRISIGLQAAQDVLLKKLGRPALFDDFVKAFNSLRLSGFDNINIDLMTGLPGQSLEDFKHSLSTVIDLGPEHISFYALEVHEGTAFSKQGVKEDPDMAADMYEAALPLLKTAGFDHYEISNFARPGRAARHNLNYWEQGDYTGLGAAAASHEAGRRWTNTADIELYIKTAGCKDGTAIEYSETLTPRQRKAERIMLGLRKTDGIELPDDIFIEFKEEIGFLLAKGLLNTEGGRVRINERFFYLSNMVFEKFV